jgi:hypothetical protein
MITGSETDRTDRSERAGALALLRLPLSCFPGRWGVVSGFKEGVLVYLRTDEILDSFYLRIDEILGFLPAALDLGGA